MTPAKPVWFVLRLVFGVFLLVGFSYGADWLLRGENFPVQNVRFEGPFQRVTPRELEGAMLDLARGNFFLVDLDAIQRRVEALPWVHRASVRRSFPHDIVIRFSEQRLVAHWGEEAWVNAQGEVVHVDASDMPSDLPRLRGPDGASAAVLAAYHEFQTALAPLDVPLTGVTLTARRSWRLDLDGVVAERPLTVLVDHEHTVQRLERFARVYTATLAVQAEAIRQIDLRYTNGFAVDWHSPQDRRVAHSAVSGNEG